MTKTIEEKIDRDRSVVLGNSVRMEGQFIMIGSRCGGGA